jgi:putative ubiquitin-RnfH superfamily antitoxin RatB of RatAB toxin-antitoxin module
MLRITLVWSPAPRQVVQDTLELPDGATVATALVRSGWKDRFGFDAMPDVAFGIWNLPAQLQTPLRDLDRVEIYRPLKVDPKVARRQRFNKQGAKAAGLFAKKRPGAKAGY